MADLVGDHSSQFLAVAIGDGGEDQVAARVRDAGDPRLAVGLGRAAEVVLRIVDPDPEGKAALNPELRLEIVDRPLRGVEDLAGKVVVRVVGVERNLFARD